MKIKCNILLIMLLCAAPFSAVAAETAPADGPKTQAPLQAAPPVAPAPPRKEVEPPRTQQQVRLGYVDIGRIAGESEPGKAGQAQMDERKKRLQAQADAKRKQLDKQRDAIEAKLSSLTPPQREARYKEFQKKVQEFQKFAQKAENELQALQQELSRSLFEKVERAAADYGAKNGFAIIIAKQELLYLAAGVDASDVTEAIIKLINEEGKK